MKKTKKNISKVFKFTLLVCMIFSQLANPIEVLAAEVVPSYELDFILDTKEDEDPLNDSFVVKNIGDKELVDDENYILEIIRSFEYKDGEVDDTKDYVLVVGNELSTGYSIEHETFNYNGVSYVEVNVYEVTDEMIDISTYPIEDYEELLTTDSVENIMSASFEEGITNNETAILYEIAGDNVVCDETDDYKCAVSNVEELNNLVKINYSLETGDFNPNKNYYVILKVNGVVSDLIDKNTKDVPSEFVIDFAKMLPGVYNVSYEVRDKNNKVVLSEVIEFTYGEEEETDEDVIEGEEVTEGEVTSGEVSEDEVIEEEIIEEINVVEFFKNAEVSQELFFSYTILTDEEKKELGNNFRYLDNPLAYLFDTLLSSNAENNEGNISSNYNLFDDKDNRYHVIVSEKFKGAFSDEDDSYKVSDVLNELKVALNDVSLVKYYVVDSNNKKVKETAYIENGMKLVVTIIGEKLEYDFLVYGDVDGGLVELDDLSELINKVLNGNLSYYDSYNLDFNGDSKIDVKDISVLGTYIFEGDYVTYEFDVTDEITSIIESDEEEIYVGESFEVLLSLDGFTDNYINAIEGLVKYDEKSLKLDSIELLDKEIFLGNSLNNRFIFASDYLFDSNEEAIVKLTFTGVSEGTHKVSVTGMNLVADGVVVCEGLTSNEIEITVNRVPHSDATLKSLVSSIGRFDKVFASDVYEYTLYVDSWVNRITLSGEVNDEYATTDGFKTYVLTGNYTQISIDVTAEDGTLNTYRVNVVKVYKSSNNNLSSLKIEGYDIDFDKNTLEYKINVGSDVTSLDISAVVEGYGAWVKIEGNENFKEGENVVTITVYAEDGSAKTYKLLVNKEAEKVVTPVVDEEPKEKVDSEKIIIISLIVLVVIGLLYLIFKKDEDEEEPRIEQIKPKKEEFVKVEEVKVDNKKNNNTNNNKNYNNKNYNKPKNKNKGKK